MSGVRYYKRIRFFAFLVLACASVLSCGGGGGAVDSPPASPPSQPPATLVVTPEFVEVTESSGINFSVGFSSFAGSSSGVSEFAGGVAAGDYDGDGDIDLFVVRGDFGPNLLYRNDGDNTFSERALEAGVAYTKSVNENFRHSGPTFADVDGDGDIDLFLGGVHGDPSLLFLNDGDGTFTDVTAASGLDSMTSPNTISAAFGDYDLDGDLDLLVSHWGTPRSTADPGDTEHLWRNDSGPTGIRFTSVSIETGISPTIITLPDPHSEAGNQDRSFAPTFARLDSDLYPDILMVSDFNTTMMFSNNGDGTFTNVTDTDVIRDRNGMGSAVADFDNDGDLDWFVTSIFYQDPPPGLPNGNLLYLNDGGTFVDATRAAGVDDGGWGWAACFLDMNNDGLLDIYHTNGWRTGGNIGNFSRDAGRAFLASPGGQFADVAKASGLYEDGQGRGVVCADFDEDGDTDVFVWSSEADTGGRLFRNDTLGNNYLKVILNGVPPNTAAAGARIWATIGDETQMREVMIASSYISHGPVEQLFGLSISSQVDALRIEWPGGELSELGVVSANQLLVVDHPGQ